jgi:hypothetical protein
VRVLVPLLFSVWCASQFHLVFVLYKLGLSQKRHIEAEAKGQSEEAMEKASGTGSSESVDSAVRMGVHPAMRVQMV